MIIKLWNKNETAVYAADELIDRFSHFEDEIGTEFDLFLFNNSVVRRFK